MFAVMVVMVKNLSLALRNIIRTFLDNSRKASFKRWIRTLKDLPWLKEKSIEIQENDEGRWIEIHLNETADERDDAVPEEDEDEQ